MATLEITQEVIDKYIEIFADLLKSGLSLDEAHTEVVGMVEDFINGEIGRK